ncbi:MAG: hypothetical protein EZS28_040418 [Streblomastix strix]|uniref:Uncharacterized protein n=1 Tax=Streblomastix strix TaxID=222440 RepID=A0A5J4U337_9EUKA|nr:MAG: hypothetical protein EZS28_040418 [Streblomastix strix]
MLGVIFPIYFGFAYESSQLYLLSIIAGVLLSLIGYGISLFFCFFSRKFVCTNTGYDNEEKFKLCGGCCICKVIKEDKQSEQQEILESNEPNNDSETRDTRSAADYVQQKQNNYQIRDLKEERRLEEDPGQSNSEQRVENKVFHVERNNRHSGDNNNQRLGHKYRPASGLPSHQRSRRDATVSILQIQWSLLNLQKNAVWSFNGSENLYQMPPASNSRSQEAMQLANLRLRRRYSDPELGSHNNITRNITSNEDPRRVWLDDRKEQELDRPNVDIRVLGLAVEQKNNDNANDNIPKERSVEAIKTSDGTSQEKETRKNKRLNIGNWRDPIHKSTIQTRRASHQVALKVEGQ